MVCDLAAFELAWKGWARRTFTIRPVVMLIHTIPDFIFISVSSSGVSDGSSASTKGFFLWSYTSISRQVSLLFSLQRGGRYISPLDSPYSSKFNSASHSASPRQLTALTLYVPLSPQLTSWNTMQCLMSSICLTSSLLLGTYLFGFPFQFSV